MRIHEFNALPLSERSKLVFGDGKLIGISKEYTVQKEFHFILNDIRINVVYDKVRKIVMDVKAVERSMDRKV
ncbi:MAG TPA: hypothetical protein VN922_09700 [Bacteroidia bacterium]|nr:hypothetical protein [Bacteroidia bacterium]